MKRTALTAAIVFCFAGSCLLMPRKKRRLRSKNPRTRKLKTPRRMKANRNSPGSGREKSPAKAAKN